MQYFQREGPWYKICVHTISSKGVERAFLDFKDLYILRCWYVTCKYWFIWWHMSKVMIQGTKSVYGPCHLNQLKEDFQIWYSYAFEPVLEIPFITRKYQNDVHMCAPALIFSLQEHQEHICTVDSHYLEFQGTLWNTLRYPYLDISDLQNWGKNNSNNHI